MGVSVKMLLSLLVFFGTAQAQESVNAAGSDATGTGGTVAFSIGQCFYSSSYIVTGSVNEGVQQVYDIIPVGNKENTNGINLTMFPNPTSGNFTLAIKSPDQSIFSYQILDMQGKLLFTKEINSPEMGISISELPVANYILNVLNSANQLVQSFKISKI